MAGYRCESCTRAFRSVTTFDKHRTGSFETRDKQGKIATKATRRCLSEAEMKVRDFHMSEKSGLWSMGGMGDTNPFTKAPRIAHATAKTMPLAFESIPA